MILLPSRGRPGNLERFARECRAFDVRQRFTILLDDDDAKNYLSVKLPENCEIEIRGRKSNGERFQDYFERHPNEPYYAFFADDVIPHTREWDTKLAVAAGAINVAWPRDGIADQPTIVFIGGDLVRTVGWLCPPGLKHLWLDTLWGEIGKALGVTHFCRDIEMEHCHYTNGKAPYDATYRERSTDGKDVFDRLIANMPEIVARCRTLYS